MSSTPSTTFSLHSSRRLFLRDLRPLYALPKEESGSAPPIVRLDICDVDDLPAVENDVQNAPICTGSERAALLLMLHHSVLRSSPPSLLGVSPYIIASTIPSIASTPAGLDGYVAAASLANAVDWMNAASSSGLIEILGALSLEAHNAKYAASSVGSTVGETIGSGCYAETTTVGGGGTNSAAGRSVGYSRAIMRALLSASKITPTTSPNDSVVSPSTTSLLQSLDAIPALSGPVRDATRSIRQLLEDAYVNDPSAITVASASPDTSAALSMASAQIMQCATLCQNASMKRMGMESTTAPLSSSDCGNWKTAAQSCREVVLALKKTYQEEIEKHVEVLRPFLSASETPATASKEINVGNPTDPEFAGKPPATVEKILKKRRDKAEKAAAKAAAKKQRAASGGLADGVVKILKILETRKHLNWEAFGELGEAVDGLLAGGAQRKPKIAKGTRDYLPDQMMIRDQAFQIIRRVFRRHGAVEIDTPVFELKETLTGKYGEDSKLIYNLADQGGELLALRYDLTVPLARFLALNSVGNIKRFHIGKVYRRDQPALARGRYREFYQCDFDIAGLYGRMVPDAECVAVACEILNSLPIGDFGLKVNHRKLLDSILEISGVPSDKFRTICSAVDKLDKEPWENVRKEMVEEKGLDGAAADRIGKFVLLNGEPREMMKQLRSSNAFGDHKVACNALEDLDIMFGYLEAMGKLKYISFDLSLARGLDYYTGVIYEAVCMSGNTQVGSIGGGGRYDNLVSMFQDAGKVTPCVGVSVGIERVFTLIEARLREKQGGSIKQPNVKVLVASTGQNMTVECMKIAQRLWDANISAEFSQKENPKLKFELRDALDRVIPFMVIVGESELAEGKVLVKDLAAAKEDKVLLDELVEALFKKGVVPVGCEFAAEMAKEGKYCLSSLNI